MPVIQGVYQKVKNLIKGYGFLRNLARKLYEMAWSLAMS